MRKLMGKWGGAIAGPLLRAVPLFLLILAALSLASPDRSSAQVWVSSSFQTTPPGPGGQLNETATCTTSAVDPASNQPSPAAADYNPFFASCDVTPSTGAVITSPQCPGGARGLASGSTSTGNPTGQCSITFQPQPGVGYTLNSIHGFKFIPDLPGTVCGPQQVGLYGFCFSDPLGYFSFNLAAYQAGLYPWAPTPPYPSTNPSNTNKEVTCKADGGVCSAQDFPNQYCLKADLLSGTPVCTGPIKMSQLWNLATSSAVYCPSPIITAVSPRTWIAGVSFSITITGTGFNSTATPSCPATTVGMLHNVFWTGTGPVTISNVAIVSPTQITATVAPDRNAFIQSIPIGVNVAPNGITAASSMAVQILGTPAIIWASDPDNTNPVISGPNSKLPNPILSNPSAVVGQQIVLTTNTPAKTLYDGPPVPPVPPQLWTVGGTNVAGWTPGSPPAPTVLSTTGLTTYWVYTQGAGAVKYHYCVNIQGATPLLQCTLDATATFAVTGPTGGSMTVTNFSSGVSIANLDACIDSNGTPWPAGPYMFYGQGITGSICDATGTAGINFDAPTGYQNTSGGSFLLVQLIGNDVGIGGCCTYGAGLDTQYPYGPPPDSDSPDTYLQPTVNSVSRTFTANMFLMWRSSTANSIPVPLGYQQWGFSGTATCNANCGTASNWTAAITLGTTPGPVGNFVPSDPSQTQTNDRNNILVDGYPTWTSTSK